MAAVAPPSDQAAELLQKLSLDSQSKTLQVSEPTKKPSAIQYAPVDSGTLANGLNKPFERSTTPFRHNLVDPTMCYLPNGYPSTTYYYGGYDGSVNEWDDYSRCINSDGVDMSTGVYGNRGALMYHHGYGYAPYGTYSPSGSPVPTMGHDGQLYGPQHYQYPTTYYQSSTTTSGHYTPNQANASQAEVTTSIAADQVRLPMETGEGNQNSLGNVTFNGTTMSKPLRPSYQNSSISSNGSYGRGGLPTGITSSGYQDPRFGFNGIHSSTPWLDSPIFSDRKPKYAASAGITSAVSHGNNFRSGRNQNLRPPSHFTGLQHPRPTSGLGQAGFMNWMCPNNRMYGQYTNTFRSRPGFGSNGYDSRINGRGWLAVDSKYKPRGRGNGFFGCGNESMDGLNELNRGPRAKGFKDQKDSGPITLAVKGQSLLLNGNNNEDNLPLFRDREKYNKEDFCEAYSDAKFFIIKSYSEDDIHKSIKYGVWASTPNGNKKLDAAYKEAQEKSGGCPVFLLFSVNASGQFVGLAEMGGCVDFNKNVEHWQQDKWNGCFPVKWHIVKDVPNNLLRHITLENNENKPVTNSRDTQEVRFEQGVQMLKIFKGHSSKTCILDDFEFYEGRQKTMQEKRAKQQQFNKQVGIGKPVDAGLTYDKDKDWSIGKQGLQKFVDVASALTEDSIAAAAAVSEVVKARGGQKLLEENVLVATAEEAPKGSKSVATTENSVVSNEVANAC